MILWRFKGWTRINALYIQRLLFWHLRGTVSVSGNCLYIYIAPTVWLPVCFGAINQSTQKKALQRNGAHTNLIHLLSWEEFTQDLSTVGCYHLSRHAVLISSLEDFYRNSVELVGIFQQFWLFQYSHCSDVFMHVYGILENPNYLVSDHSYTELTQKHYYLLQTSLKCMSIF